MIGPKTYLLIIMKYHEVGHAFTFNSDQSILVTSVEITCLPLTLICLHRSIVSIQLR